MWSSDIIYFIRIWTSKVTTDLVFQYATYTTTQHGWHQHTGACSHCLTTGCLDLFSRYYKVDIWCLQFNPKISKLYRKSPRIKLYYLYIFFKFELNLLWLLHRYMSSTVTKMQVKLNVTSSNMCLLFVDTFISIWGQIGAIKVPMLGVFPPKNFASCLYSRKFAKFWVFDKSVN